MAKVARVQGQVQGPRGPLSPGASLGPDVVLEVPQGGELALDLSRHARVEVGAGARLRLGQQSGALVLALGTAHLRLAPGEQRAGPGLRLGTPALSLRARRSGECLVTVAPSGLTRVDALSGQLELQDGRADGEGKLQGRLLGAGQTLTQPVAKRGLAEPRQGPRTLAQARAQSLAEPPGDGESSKSQAQRLHASFGAALDEVEQLVARGPQLAAEQRSAKAEGDRDRMRALQTQLVAHGQALLRARETLRVRWERTRALRLTLPEGDGPQAASDARVARALAP